LVGDYTPLPYTFPSKYQLLFTTGFDTHFAGFVRIIYQNLSGATVAPTTSFKFRIISFSGTIGDLRNKAGGLDYAHVLNYFHLNAFPQ